MLQIMHSLRTDDEGVGTLPLFSREQLSPWEGAQLTSYSNIAKKMSYELDNANISKLRMKLWSEICTYWPELADAIRTNIQVQKAEDN